MVSSYTAEELYTIIREYDISVKRLEKRGDLLENELRYKLLFLQAMKGRKLTLRVSGISMYPALCEGDHVTIRRCEEYKVGDILVFQYEPNMLLIHRLLYKTDLLYCKGDNAFRIEEVNPNNVVGKVILHNNKRIDNWPIWKINFSYLINCIFLKNKNDVSKTKITDEYQFYNEVILHDQKKSLKYCRNVPKALEDNNLKEGSHSIKLKYSNLIAREEYQNLLDVLSSPCTITELKNEMVKKSNKSDVEVCKRVEEMLARAIINKDAIVVQK